MSKIIDRAGSGASITAVENDANLDSLHGINQVIAGATHTVDITDQGDTLEFINAGAVAVTLDDIGTIQGAAHTSDFHVTLIATNAATVVTITPDATDSINTGVATIVLTVDEYVTLETDSTGAIWNIINSSDASQVGGLSASQFLRSDTNDTATGDLDFTGAVDLQGTWEIGSVQVTSTAAELNILDGVTVTAADINDLVDKSSAQTITEEKTFDANIVFDATVTERRIQFNGGTELTWLAGLANGDIVLWDNTNSRAVFFYEPAADTFTARNFNALNAVLTTPALTNATGSLSSPVINTSVSGTALETTITNTNTKIPVSGAVFDKVAGLNTKVIDIGDWNMDATASVNVLHGLTLSKIRPPFDVMIRNDTSTLRYDFGSYEVVSLDSSHVRLARTASGFFDDTDFDSTGYNRGWITIHYTD